jgi:cytochrome c oxidase subunit 4
MNERLTSPTTYGIVFLLLVGFTILTVAVSFVPLAGHWHLIAGLAIAGIKASLVVLFFMHVLVSHRLTWITIIVACGWLSLLVTLTFCDYLTRGLVPFATGH